MGTTDVQVGIQRLMEDLPDCLPELREMLKELLLLLHWCHLDSWVDELLDEVRAGYRPVIHRGP